MLGTRFLKIWDVIQARNDRSESHMDAEGIAYLNELISLFPKECEIEFLPDGSMDTEGKVFALMDSSIDFIDEQMINNAKEYGLDLKKIVDNKPKYLKMFKEFFEKSKKNLEEEK